jgi:hypothetical protein
MLRKLDPIHHRGVRLALGTIAVCKTVNVLCEAELPTLMEMRTTGTSTTTKQWNPDHSKLLMRVAELLGQIDIDGRKVEKTPDYITPLWYTDDGKSMDWSLCKMGKGIPNEIFRAEFQKLVNEKYNDHIRIYTDGSKMEEKVGYAIVTDPQSKRRSIRARSHHRRNTKTTDNKGQRSDIYWLTKHHDGRIRKQPHEKSEDQKD